VTPSKSLFCCFSISSALSNLFSNSNFLFLLERNLAKAILSDRSPSVFLRSTCFSLASAPKVFGSVPKPESIFNTSLGLLIVDMPG